MSDKVDFVINSSLKPKEGIFFEGEIFDAYAWLNDKIENAGERIIVIDPYADVTVLKQLTRRKDGVKATIYTNPRNQLISLDVRKFNIQYPEIKLKKTYGGHDRFLIIDDTIYHVGGSMKDLGNRLMAYSELQSFTPGELILRIEEKKQ